MELVDVTDSKSVGGDIVRVRVPPPAPRRSKLYIACSDFFQKSERAHAAAPPFQIEAAMLGCDLVLGTNLETAASILLLRYSKHDGQGNVFARNRALPVMQPFDKKVIRLFRQPRRSKVRFASSFFMHGEKMLAQPLMDLPPCRCGIGCPQ